MCEAAIPNLPEGIKDFVVYCNASILYLSVVLMHMGRIIVYVSRQLKPDEVNYLTHDLELGVMVITVKI